MSLESAAEQAIKTAFKAYTNTLDPGDAVTYRCFFLDDETESEDSIEERRYPLIAITASPNVPTGHKSTFRDVPMEIKFATHRVADPKHETLIAIYAACRAILDTETTISPTGYSLIAAWIESGGESGIDDNEQFITLPITMKVCGA